MVQPDNTITSDRTLIFFHIPKTAGATFAQIIERQYPPDVLFITESERHWESTRALKQLPESAKRAYRAISGHMYFGVHRYLPQNYEYITLLRDPVERIISYYYFILRYPGHYLYETITARQLTLQDVLESGVSKEFNNGQTRLLSGMQNVAYGECDAKLLDLALENLQTHFRLAGTTDRFDEFLVLSSKLYGWKKPFYIRKHVARKRPHSQDLSKQVRDSIKKHNQLDIALYEYVERKFDTMIRNQDSSFEQEMRRFQLLNAVYTFSQPLMHKVNRGLHTLVNPDRSK